MLEFVLKSQSLINRIKKWIYKEINEIEKERGGTEREERRWERKHGYQRKPKENYLV